MVFSYFLSYHGFGGEGAALGLGLGLGSEFRGFGGHTLGV